MKVPPRFAVVGNPIGHSLSPEVHTEFARQTGIELEYDRLFAPLKEFSQVVQAFFHSGGRGLNVTAPFKGQAAAWVDVLDQRAALTESVNTIALELTERGETQIKGYSTDGPGLIADLRGHWGLCIEGLRILMVGAGGAARGVIPTLLERNPNRLVVANRTPARAEALIDRYRDLTECELRAQTLDAQEDGFNLVLNAASELFERADPLQLRGIEGAFCYDLSYNRNQQTGFCQQAKRLGARDVRDGLGMLVWQAAYSFEIWHGVLPDAEQSLKRLSHD